MVTRCARAAFHPGGSRYGWRVEPFDEARARSAGTACAKAGTSDVVDAAVVVGAAVRQDLVVTTDAADLSPLRDAISVELALQEI